MQITKMFDNANIRFVEYNGQIWINNKDVCDYLEYADARARMRQLDDDEKVCFEFGSNKDGFKIRLAESHVHGNWFVNESGLYRLIIGSQKDTAKKFRKWITSEVIPSIMRTGQYGVDLSDPLAIAEYATKALRDERNKRLELESQVNELEHTIDEQKPKVEFHDAVANAENAVSIGEFAKRSYDKLGLGQNQMFNRLRGIGFLMDNNEPYQKHINAGYARLIEKTFTKGNGEPATGSKTLITGKGEIYLVKELSKGQAIMAKGK